MELLRYVFYRILIERPGLIHPIGHGITHERVRRDVPRRPTPMDRSRIGHPSGAASDASVGVRPEPSNTVRQFAALAWGTPGRIFRDVFRDVSVGGPKRNLEILSAGTFHLAPQFLGPIDLD